MAPAALTIADLDDLLDDFEWDDWNPKLAGILKPAFLKIAIEQAERDAERYGLTFNPKDPFTQRFFTEYLGERIKQLADTTKAIVIEELHRALEDDKGEGAAALATRLSDAVADSAALSPARALMIARTETAIAYNTGAVLTYRQNGIDKVEVSDGDEDDECAEADGSIWTLDRALAEPTSHPNCVRSFSPVLDDEEETEE